jgi:hypothetical protein
MKPAVSVTLIICGTFLILAPWLFQYLQLRELTELAAALKWDQLNYDSSRHDPAGRLRSQILPQLIPVNGDPGTAHSGSANTRGWLVGSEHAAVLA